MVNDSIRSKTVKVILSMVLWKVLRFENNFTGEKKETIATILKRNSEIY